VIHYIEGFNGEHRIDELVLLCQKHHRLADLGLAQPESNEGIPRERLHELKRYPFNRDKVGHHFSVPTSKPMIVHMGGNIFVDVPDPICVIGERLIRLRREGGQLLVGATFYDSSDSLVLKIQDNVWEADTTIPDLRYSESGSSGDVRLAVKMNGLSSFLDFQIKSAEIHVKGTFFRHGRMFEVRDDGTFVLGRSLTMTGCTFPGPFASINLM
jgi:hypothetical protein